MLDGAVNLLVALFRHARSRFLNCSFFHNIRFICVSCGFSSVLMCVGSNGPATGATGFSSMEKKWQLGEIYNISSYSGKKTYGNL